MRRQTDSGRLHEDTGDKTGPEIMVAPDSEAPSNPRIAAAQESPSAAEARHSADLYIRTSWVDAALALSELEKVQCSLYSTQSIGVKLRLSYCTCDCFSANVNRAVERGSAGESWRRLVAIVCTIKAARTLEAFTRANVIDNMHATIKSDVNDQVVFTSSHDTYSHNKILFH